MKPRISGKCSNKVGGIKIATVFMKNQDHMAVFETELSEKSAISSSAIPLAASSGAYAHFAGSGCATADSSTGPSLPDSV